MTHRASGMWSIKGCTTSGVVEGHLDDFEIPEAFVTKEVPLKLAQLRERWERYVVLNAEWAARGRRGFERNPRDD